MDPAIVRTSNMIFSVAPASTSASLVVPKDLQSLKSVGFTTLPKSADKLPRISMLTSGKTKTGKTYWALNTTPEPVAAFLMDPGSLAIAQEAINKGRLILPRIINHSKKETKEDAEKLWKEYRVSVRAVLAAPSIRTLVIDTATELWELARIAEFGPRATAKGHNYVGLNNEFGGLIDEIYYARPDLNIIYIQKLKKQYEGDNWDGKSWETKGFGEMEYQVDISIIHSFHKGKFAFKISETEATRFGPDYAGLKFEGDECSFADLALHIFKDHPAGSDPGYWGIKI